MFAEKNLLLREQNKLIRWQVSVRLWYAEELERKDELLFPRLPNWFNFKTLHSKNIPDWGWQVFFIHFKAVVEIINYINRVSLLIA